MRSLRQKLLLYIVLIGVIPMLFFSAYYCDYLQKESFNRLENESKTLLERFDNKLVVKVSRIQNMSDIMFNDSEFCRVITRSGTTEESRIEMQTRLDDIYSRFLRAERELAAILLFPVNGGIYISGDKSFGQHPQSLIVQYDNSSMTIGSLTWLGLKDKPHCNENKIVIAGTMLRDETYLRDESYLGTVYLIFGDSIFDDTKNYYSQIPSETDEGYKEPEEDKESISVYDENLNLIYTRGSKKLGNALLTAPIQQHLSGIQKPASEYVMEIDEEKYMLISYISPITGWKFVRTFPYENYFKESRRIIYVIAICFVLMFGLWYIVNRVVVRRMTLPISELLSAMKQVEMKNFDVVLKVRPRSDFGIISSGFNSMLVQIKTLLERVVSAEKQKREQDVLMLRYQMNPHFLYNTIGAIRMTAILNKQDKIAQMLLILSRFLRNAIRTANESIDVRSEVANISDYVSLYQLRYCEQVHFTIDVDEGCYDYRIPSMLCQPIIENSLIHGLSDKLSAGDMAEIKMKIETDGEDLLIKVRDNGKGISKQKIEQMFSEEDVSESTDRLHIGLRNIQKRIQLEYGDNYGLTVASEEGIYTNVTIRLPKRIDDPR